MVNNVKLRVIAEAAKKTGLCGAERRSVGKLGKFLVVELLFLINCF